MEFVTDLFSLYSEYLTNEVLERFEDFEVTEQVTSTERYADDLVLLAKEGTVLQNM